jgi:polysaccharide export outer membrane protein
MGVDDVIEVSVYKDPDLTRTVPVRPDGKISLPIVGEVVASGRTPEEIRTEVIDRLHQYVKDPTVVSVIVREVHSARFYVIGEVMKPGVYPLHDDTTALQAVAVAGGAGEFSARDRATVIRAAGGGRVVVDLDDPQSAAALVLRSGDTVMVR